MALDNYWLCNTITSDAAGSPSHLNLLLTRSPENGPAATAIFITRWSEAGFEFGYRAAPSATWTLDKNWPLQVTIPGDSGQTPWRWRLDRKSIWLDAELASQPLHAHGKFPAQREFDLQSIHQGPAIEAIPSLPITWADNHQSGQFHLGTYAVPPSYLAQPGALVWLDLDLPGGQLTALLHHDTDGQLLTNGCLYRDANGKITPLPTLLPELDPTQTWISPRSHKTYPLTFSLALPTGRITIRPSTQDQELPLGRNAFWMGAVEATDAAQKSIARGNMYVFAH